MIDFSRLKGLPMVATIHTDEDGKQTVLETRLPDILVLKPQTTGEKYGAIQMPHGFTVRHEPMMPLVRRTDLMQVPGITLKRRIG